MSPALPDRLHHDKNMENAVSSFRSVAIAETVQNVTQTFRCFLQKIRTLLHTWSLETIFGRFEFVRNLWAIIIQI